jgi:hypothetical protein
MSKLYPTSDVSKLNYFLTEVLSENAELQSYLYHICDICPKRKGEPKYSWGRECYRCLINSIFRVYG